MRTGGFPCRLAGCDRSFQVLDQKSMESLTAASAARSVHEIADHDYHHQKLADERSFAPNRRVVVKPIGRI